MKIYIDSDFKCHITDDGTMNAVETDVFAGKCKEYIEGFRFVPSGAVWVRSDGHVFRAGMVAPWKDSGVLQAYQEQYEAMLPEMQDMHTALTELGVTTDG